MASIHRRPASKYWHAFFRDSEGRLVDKSTRLKDRKQAQRVADTLEMAAQRKKSAQHARAVFAQIFQDTLPGNNVGRYISLLCGSMARNQKAGNRPGPLSNPLP